MTESRTPDQNSSPAATDDRPPGHPPDDSPPDRSSADLVGARPRAEVELAHDALEAYAAAPQRQTQYSRGALAGYLWTLGRGTSAPVTGARPAFHSPDLPRITAEIEASAAQLREQSHRMAPRDYIHGAHDALCWVCGLRQDAPSGVVG